LVSPRLPMVTPRAHDCITLYLGSRERYGDEFRQTPGTYWYAPDYIERGSDEGKHVALGSANEDDMTKVYAEYVEKYGQDNADYLMEVMGAWKQHYTRAAYIENQDIALPDYTTDVRELAERRGWEFARLPGNLLILRDLLEGRWDTERFLTVPPGRTIVPTYDERVVTDAAPEQVGAPNH
ncbi:MAG: DUF1638 domain-containing protein, partial [Chloroflexota bacterium]